MWVSAEAVAGWQAEARTGRDFQPTYSALAIAAALTTHAVFCLALRHTESLIGPVIAPLGPELAVPDYSTMSRRAEPLKVPGPDPGGEPVHLLVDGATAVGPRQVA